MKPVRARLLLVSILAELLLASGSYAEYTFEAGIRLREEYNDNIYLASDNREDDFITTISPSFKLAFDISTVELNLDYGLNFRFYADHSRENETSFERSQRANFQTNFLLYKDVLSLSLSDEYSRVPIDQREKVAIDNLIVNMTDRNIFIISPQLQYPITGTLKARASYIYENRWYRDNPRSNLSDHTADLSLVKELSEKLVSNVSYRYLFHRPELFIDRYDNQNATVGVDYQATPKLALRGSGGYSWFNYDTGRSSESAIWDTSAKYQVTSKTALSAAYHEKYSTAVLSGTFRQRSGSVAVEYTGAIPVTLSVFEFTDVYEVVNRKDTGQGAVISSRVQLGQRLSGTVLANYTHYRFLPQDIETDRVGAALTLDYDTKMTKLSLGYTHNLTDSTQANSSFRNNIIWAQAGFTY
ncbi:MAG TPA: TIGR03016 family PEP-CTERM system-associated outer membrane protein [Thermodesulfobacteriota bacterium]